MGGSLGGSPGRRGRSGRQAAGEAILTLFLLVFMCFSINMTYKPVLVKSERLEFFQKVVWAWRMWGNTPRYDPRAAPDSPQDQVLLRRGPRSGHCSCKGGWIQHPPSDLDTVLTPGVSPRLCRSTGPRRGSASRSAADLPAFPTPQASAYWYLIR